MELLLYLAAIVIMMAAQAGVQGRYRKYSQIRSDRGRSGAEVARKILDSKGLYHVRVEQNPNSGVLSDHFDPKQNVVRLSRAVYMDDSIASVAVAAHEVGHAIQYAEGYRAIAVRNTILPFAIVAQNLGWAAIFLGFMSNFDGFIGIGILMLLIIAAFQLITLPVEFNASKRALVLLESDGYLDEDEVRDAKSMLSAAAFTYVAALIATLANILRILMTVNRRRK